MRWQSALPVASSRARLRVALLSVAALGCGRIDFDLRAQLVAPDATDSDARLPADADVPPPCTLANDFGTPTLISELSDPDVWDGTLRLLPDELSGYFWRTDLLSTDQDIFYATRSSFSAPFSITPAQGINTAQRELDPTISSDGSVLVFRRNMPGDELWVGSAVAPGVFDSVAELTTLNTGSTESQGFMPIGIDELYFQSTRSGGGDIYVSARTGTSFAAPVLVPGLASPDAQGDPVVTPDGLTIYFRADTPAAFGGFNIFVATRSTPTGAFGTPTLVPNINTDADDGPSWISPDGCRLYISSNIAGTNDIYVATRPL